MDGATNNSNMMGIRHPSHLEEEKFSNNDNSNNRHSSKIYVEHNYQDHNQDPIFHPEDADASAKRRGPRGGVLVPFPERLYQMLCCVPKDGFDDVVSWQPHGRCFVVHQPQRFVSEVMPKYFSQTKLTSFQRQVNLYGFRRLTTGPDRSGYYHEFFLRGRPDLLKRIARVRVKGIGCKLAPSPTTEPNFYHYPTCHGRTQDCSASPGPEECISKPSPVSPSSSEREYEMVDLFTPVLCDAYGRPRGDQLLLDDQKKKKKFPAITSDYSGTPDITLSTCNDNSVGFAYLGDWAQRCREKAFENSMIQTPPMGPPQTHTLLNKLGLSPSSAVLLNNSNHDVGSASSWPEAQDLIEPRPMRPAAPMTRTSHSPLTQRSSVASSTTANRQDCSSSAIKPQVDLTPLPCNSRGYLLDIRDDIISLLSSGGTDYEFNCQSATSCTSSAPSRRPDTRSNQRIASSSLNSNLHDNLSNSRIDFEETSSLAEFSDFFFGVAEC